MALSGATQEEKELLRDVLYHYHEDVADDTGGNIDAWLNGADLRPGGPNHSRHENEEQIQRYINYRRRVHKLYEDLLAEVGEY